MELMLLKRRIKPYSEMLNKHLYVVFIKPTNGMIPVMKNLE